MQAIEPITVLALPGSLRRHSWNRMLLEAAAARAPDSMRIVIGDISSIPLFSEDLERADADGTGQVARLRERVRKADGLLIATPEYNQSIPGVLKNTLDWLSRPAPDEVLIGKPVAIMGASVGRWGTRLAQAALRQVLHATETLVIPQPGLYVREAALVFDGAGRIVDAAVAATLDSILQSLVSAIGSVRMTAVAGQDAAAS